MGHPNDAVDKMLGQWSRERPDLDSTGMAIVLRILMHAGALADRLKVTLAPMGLASWEFDVLSALRRSSGEGGLTSKDLCESAQLTSGAMTHRLDRLEERGFIRRKTRKSDRRSILVTLTPRGTSLVDKAIEQRMADAADCMRGLTKTDQRKLIVLLRALAIAPAE